MNQIPQLLDKANTLSFLPLGGIGDVTKNMYLYQYGDEILIVDCGIGFADETMFGVDLLLPDISYLLSTKKKIVGMVLSHGHEDHIGALPYILPQLPNIPIFGSALTAAFANEKLKEFNVQSQVKTVDFEGGEVKLGRFTVSFIRVTHSVPDTAHIFIKTPVGNFYHGSDYKFDLTPADGKKSDFGKISKAANEGILALFSDCLGSERQGFSQTEIGLVDHFDQAIRDCQGKCIITTYSSNIARLNQVVTAAVRNNRKICFVGRSLIKAKTIAQRLGYMQLKAGIEVSIDQLKNHGDQELVLVVAGSQGQENSAMLRMATDAHREVKLSPKDTVIFSSDPIPGNEVSVNSLVDALTKKGAKVLYTDITREFHVSGHGSAGDLMLLMSLTKAKYLSPISGNYKHMVAYQQIAERFGYQPNQIMLPENGRELLFSQNGVKYGQKFPLRNIYVDQISGEEVESFVLRDREKLAKEGIVIVIAEVQAENGQLADTPDIVTRGLAPTDTVQLTKALTQQIQKVFSSNTARVTNWVHMRKLISETVSRAIFTKLQRRPLVLPVVIEV